MTSSTRQPVLFLGHGSPMNAIDDNRWRRSWVELGRSLRARAVPPSRIVCVSAHWQTMGWRMTAMARPPTVHDFGGFPQALFDQQYPAPGDPALVRAIASGLDQPVEADLEGWGLDHGTWSVLMPMFPEADIPVVQLSLNQQASPQAHLALGRQLRAWREQGVLIVGSGNVVHNLRAMRRSAEDNEVYDWALAFDRSVAEIIDQGRLHDLARCHETGEVADLAHPSREHFLPLLVAAGAVHADEPARFFNTGFQGASISMRSVVWG